MTQKRWFLSLTTTLLALSLCACTAKPTDSQPAHGAQSPSTTATPAAGSPAITTPASSSGPEHVDEAVRIVLKSYLAAMNTGMISQAEALVSPLSSWKPVKIAGLSNWHFISSEMIESTDTTAYVQLNFTLSGTAEGYSDGRNVRYVRLRKENGAWHISGWATNP